MGAMYSHAQTEYPKESCGIMIGNRLEEYKVVCQILQMENMAGESQNRSHFVISPLEVFKAETLAKEQGLEIVGFYHSHTDYDAAPSAEDILYMIAGYSYLILSVRHGACVGACCFEKAGQAGDNIRQEIVAARPPMEMEGQTVPMDLWDYTLKRRGRRRNEG